jgi:hypothetical protein
MTAKLCSIMGWMNKLIDKTIVVVTGVISSTGAYMEN